MFELFDHTADLGIRLQAADLDSLMADAAKALFSILLATPDAVRPLEERHFALSADRPDDLLRDWLAELLYTFDARRMVFSQFAVRTFEGRLEATARGEPLDPRHHHLAMEIKAVTYHGRKVVPTAAGWMAEGIVDL